jgi:hypothetical protein
MTSNLQELPDPQERLSEGARKRINRAFAEGSAARESVRLAYQWGDPESELALEVANFNFALHVLSVKSAELRWAGIRGEQLGEIICLEIESAVNSMELGEVNENYLAELLLTDWGW